MKATNYFTIFFILSSTITSLQIQSTRGADSILPDDEIYRRILHQPLFPVSSSPPQFPPPPPSGQDLPGPEQPFFHELPYQPTPDQAQQPPPSQPITTAPAANAQRSKPTKKVAIAVTSGILSLAMVSALAFYLYRHGSKNQDDSQKLFAASSERTNGESIVPPSTFLYIGTVEPSATSILPNETNGSPYRKLNPGKRSERYRPSPDLQPLPPLPKPPPPPSINSPPPMSSSDDDESHDTNFYTPQGSSMSNGSPSSRHSYLNNNITSQVNRVPRSKRTSPKSRLSAPSPDAKTVIIPSIKQPPPTSPPEYSSLDPPQPSRTQSYAPKRPKFAAPPPPPDLAKLQLITNDDQQTRAIPIPPPPPPPPPSAALPPKPRKFGSIEPHTPSPVPKQMIRPESMSPSPKANPGTEITTISPTDEANKCTSSSEKSEREDRDGSKPKLKPLHWDKVRATSERATAWDQLKSGSFQLNEDAMESLFGCNSTNSVPKEAANRRSVLPASEQENRVLDPKKSQNIAILIRALNVTREEVSEALLDGNPEGLGPELLETLVKMAPTKEEEIKLKEYNGEITKLGSAERFLKAILDIPFAFKRVEAMLYRANFNTEVAYLRKSFRTLEEASEELKNSRLFLKLLQAVLRTGNRMNDGTNRGDARAFKLDTLLKLVDIKGADGKTTLLHFVVQEIIRSEGSTSDNSSGSQPNKTNFEFKEEEFRKQGLQVVSGLSKELGNVKKAAGMDSDVLSGYVSKLEIGLEKVRLVMQYERQSAHGKFFDSMREFLNETVGEIARIKEEERKALSHVKEATEYFHGDAAKEEAHPLRIFLIVRDFLAILDNVCKDVGRIHGGATVGAGRSFRMPVDISLPVLNRYHTRRDGNSDDDDI
ncbi:hypothetical protein OROHE_002529 [Orobanche hederae]